MEALLKDLDKLESKSCGSSIAAQGIDESIAALTRWRDALAAEDGMEGSGDMGEDELAEKAIAQLASSNARLAEYHKDWSSALTKYGKTVEKKFNVDLTPILPAVTSTSVEDEDSQMFFSSNENKRTIDNVLAMHFVRSGKDALAQTFLKESGVDFPRDKLLHFATLHRVTNAIREGDLELAFRWVEAHQPFLRSRNSPLEYHLHRSQFVRLLLSDTYPLPPSLATMIASSEPTPPTMNGHSPAVTMKGPHRALAYAREHFRQFYAKHLTEISRLSASALYLPVEKLLSSPYGDMYTSDGVALAEKLVDPPAADPAAETYHAPHLINLFSSEFCTSLNMSKDLPLKVVTDIGGGGALSRIAKVRGVLKEKRTEWTSVQELPVEIPLPPEYRYHSVFACPVSKEQATDANPPMMMPCGHVVANQTLMRLCKGGQNVRCPYCPLSSSVSQAIRVYF